jgi:hypothetical protein
MRIAASFVLLALASAALAEPLVVHEGRLFIQAKINGAVTEALLDSAAEATLVDPAFAAAARLPTGQEITIRGSGGEAKARVVEGVKLELLGRNVPLEAVVVSDLSEISKRLIKRPTHAIVGREAFDAMPLLIDIEGGGTITVAAGPPRGTRLALTAHAGVEAIPVLAGTMSAQAEFDLGNGSGVLVSRAVAEKLKLAVTGKKSGGGIGGELVRDTTVLPSLTVAGRTFHDVPAAIDDLPTANDFNIGTSILRHFLITTDFKQRAVWLEPRK